MHGGMDRRLPPPPCFLEVVILRELKLIVVYEIGKCGFCSSYWAGNRKCGM
jgi:hypothetical protein